MRHRDRSRSNAYSCYDEQAGSRRSVFPHDSGHRLHVDREECHVILDAGPAWVRQQCGESYFEERGVDAIQSLIESVEQNAKRTPHLHRPAREAAILELYRHGEIGSGRAAQDLGMSRVGFFELARRHQIPTIQITADELEAEFASLAS